MDIDPNKLDREQSERVSNVLKSFFDGDRDSIDDLFLSERVDGEIYEPKIIIESFNIDEIMANMPFSDKLYVLVCPECIKNSNLHSYKTLISKAAIVPITIAPYGMYPQEMIEETFKRDHMNRYEYYNWRSITLRSHYERGICKHCVSESEKNILYASEKNKSLSAPKEVIERTIQNLAPFINPDFMILDELQKAVELKDPILLKSLYQMSNIINTLRTAEAMEAPLLLNADRYAELPHGILESFDFTISVAESSKRQIADGVGLSIPSDIPLEAYIEISNDFRPKLEQLTSRLANGKDKIPIDTVSIQQEIMRINGEVERIGNSTRKIVLEAGIEFYQKNSMVVNAALAASALGLVHGTGWLGCLAGGGASFAASSAKRFGALKGGAAVERAEELVERSVQPVIDSLVAKYVGASPTTVRVMSLRRGIDRAASKRRAALSKGTATKIRKKSN